LGSEFWDVTALSTQIYPSPYTTKGYLQFQLNYSVFFGSLRLVTHAGETHKIRIELVNSSNCSDFPHDSPPSENDSNFTVVPNLFVDFIIPLGTTIPNIIPINPLLNYFISMDNFTEGNYIGLVITSQSSTSHKNYYNYDVGIPNYYPRLVNCYYYTTEVIDYGEKGLYLGNYTFTDDIDGDNASGWDSVCYTGTGEEVVSEIGDHKKVMMVWDDHAVNKPTITNTFSGDMTNETIEFWCRTSNVTQTFYFIIKDGSNYCVYFVIQSSKFRRFDGSWFDILDPIINNAWYHIQLDFDPSGWQVTINQTLYGSGYAFAYRNAYVDGMNSFVLLGEGAVVNQIIYIDAVDYNWTDGYYLHRNYNENYFFVFETNFINPLNSLKLEAQKIDFNYRDALQLNILGEINNTEQIASFHQTNNSLNQLKYIDSYALGGRYDSCLQFNLSDSDCVGELVRIEQDFSINSQNITSSIVFSVENTSEVTANGSKLELIYYDVNKAEVLTIQINATTGGVLIGGEGDSFMVSYNTFYKLYIIIRYELDEILLILLDSEGVISNTTVSTFFNSYGLGKFALEGSCVTNSYVNITIDYIQLPNNYDYAYIGFRLPILTYYDIINYYSIEIELEGVFSIFQYKSSENILYPIYRENYYSGVIRCLLETFDVSTGLVFVIHPNSTYSNNYINYISFNVLKLSNNTIQIDKAPRLIYPDYEGFSNEYMYISNGKLYFVFEPYLDGYLQFTIVLNTTIPLRLHYLTVVGKSVGQSINKLDFIDNASTNTLHFSPFERTESLYYSSNLRLEKIYFSIIGDSFTYGHIQEIKIQEITETSYVITKFVNFLIPMLLIFIPSLGVRETIGKEAFLPTVLLMTLISFITGLIPLWIMLITTFAIVTIFVERMRSKDN